MEFEKLATIANNKFNQSQSLLSCHTEVNKLALWEGNKHGTIYCIVSNHQQKTIEEKDIEFDNAGFGSITLHSIYASLIEKNSMDQSDFIDKISSQPRKMANFEADTSINENNITDLTIFEPTIEWKLDKETNLSKSEKSSFFGQKKKGKASGIGKINTLTLNK
jgi:dihydroorotase